MIIKENTITEFIQHSTGFTISKSDLINVKVVVNNIEITSIEDWNKVTKSLIELQQENKKLHNKIDKAIEDITFCINGMKNEYACVDYRTDRELHTMVNILEDTIKVLKNSDVDE